MSLSIHLALFACIGGMSVAQRFLSNFPPWFRPWSQSTPFTLEPITEPPATFPDHPTVPSTPDAVAKWQEALELKQRRRKKKCTWTRWKGNGRCLKDAQNMYRMKQKRTKILAKNGSRNCVGLAERYVACTENQFVATTFVDTVFAQSKGPSRAATPSGGFGQRFLSFPNIPNQCAPDVRDAKGKLLMIGKQHCQMELRIRRNAEALIETQEVRLKQMKTRVKRQEIQSTMHRDLLFLLDESYSVGYENYLKEVKMAKTITEKFSGSIDIAKLQTRVGIVSFDSTQHVHLNFDEYFSKSEVLKHMDNGVQYTSNTGTSTCLLNALNYTQTTMMKKERGARINIDGTERVVVLFTDGCANCENADKTPQMLTDMSKELEEKNIAFITFFIGSEDSCVTKMASLADGSRCYQVFRAESWEAFDEMIANIASRDHMDAWYIGPSCHFVGEK